MAGPLEGIRILDLSQWQQGPYASVLLSDMGADVIKVERPGYGDSGRHGMGGWNAEGPTPDFFAHNRGKRGVTLNLGHPQGREVVLDLAERCDVVMHNFRVGMMERWDLGYEVFRERNPRIIYAKASGSGPNGPDTQRPMFDIVAQARAGIMSVNGEPGAPPTPVGTFQADQIGAMMLAFSILGALVARERTGVGQTIDVSLLGTQVALQSYEITHYLFTGRLPQRAGRGHPHTDPLWGTFEAADGYFVIAGCREDRWAAFCEAIGDPALATEPRFDCRDARLTHREAFVERLDVNFRRAPVAHWIDVLSDLDVACGAVQDYAQVVEDPQLLANGYIAEIDDANHGRLRIVNTPIAYGATPIKPQGSPPELGQHTEEVLLELGYDWPRILELRDAGAI